jgi:hypothetical protein
MGREKIFQLEKGRGVIPIAMADPPAIHILVRFDADNGTQQPCAPGCVSKKSLGSIHHGPSYPVFTKE